MASESNAAMMDNGGSASDVPGMDRGPAEKVHYGSVVSADSSAFKGQIRLGRCHSYREHSRVRSEHTR